MEEKKQVPRFFYKAESVDQLKEALNLLPHMVEHPEFPFGKEDLFTMLAAGIKKVYQTTYPE